MSKITLNAIPMAADNFNINKIDIDNSVVSELRTKIPVYKVKVRQYSDQDINNIVTKGLNAKIKRVDINNSVMEIKMDTDDEFVYYKESGTIKYNSHIVEKRLKSIKNKLTDNEYKDISDTFITRTQIYDLKELEFDKVIPSIQVESSGTSSRIETLAYDVVYTIKSPPEVDGFIGTGPGIKVTIDADRNVVGFISINKSVKKTNLEFDSKDETEIKKDIYNVKNVQIYSENTNIKSVELNELDYVLYCDPTIVQQEYMVPHYCMSNKLDDNQVSIILPAIRDSQIQIQ